MRRRRENHYAMKWKMRNKVTLNPVKNQGCAYQLRIKAKGTATRRVRYEVDDEGNRQKKFNDHERVKSISYRLVQKHDGAEGDTWKIYGDLNRGRECHWDNVMYTADEHRGINRVSTKQGSDPSLALLAAHLCATEYDAGAVKNAFRPQWERQKFYHEVPTGAPTHGRF